MEPWDNIRPEEFGESFTLPSSDEPKFKKVTVVFSKEQHSAVMNALKKVGKVKETFGNTNKKRKFII